MHIAKLSSYIHSLGMYWAIIPASSQAVDTAKNKTCVTHTLSKVLCQFHHLWSQHCVPSYVSGACGSLCRGEEVLSPAPAQGLQNRRLRAFSGATSFGWYWGIMMPLFLWIPTVPVWCSEVWGPLSIPSWDQTWGTCRDSPARNTEQSNSQIHLKN